MHTRGSVFVPCLAGALVLAPAFSQAPPPVLTATIVFTNCKAMDSILNAANGQRNLLIGGGGIVEIRSGATGALLGTLTGGTPGSTFGHAVAAVGDQDGDGQEDILVGAPRSAVNGQVFLFSGSRGAGYPLLATFSPDPTNVTVTSGGSTHINTQMAYGWSVSRLDNLSGTGAQEFAIGAPGWEFTPGGFSSPRTGLVEICTAGPAPVPMLTTLFGTNRLEEFGSSVTMLRNLGGVTADIPANFAVGSPALLDPNDNGSVSVFSGLILSLPPGLALISKFQQFPFPTRMDLGTCLSATDANGDGQEDVLTGLPDVGNMILITSAYVQFGPLFNTGRVLGTTAPVPFNATTPFVNTGWSVSECGSFDANPGDEVLAGAPDAIGSLPQIAGHAFILTATTSTPGVGIVHDIPAPQDVLSDGDPSFGTVVSEIDTSLRWFAVAAPATSRVYIYH